MLNYLLLILLFMSCAHRKKENKPDEAQKPSFSAEQMCQQGHPMACYLYGIELLSQNKKEQAVTLFEQSCAKNVMGACSDLGIQLYQAGQKTRAMELTLKACQEGSSLGCYNAACYYCLDKRKDMALLFLEKSKKLGYDNLEWALKDEDLKCLHHSDEFKKWLDSYHPGQVQRSLSPYHLNFAQFGFSIQVPQGFEFNFGHPLEFYHMGGMRMQIMVATISPYDHILATENSIERHKSETDFKIIKDENLTVNTLPYRHITFQFKRSLDEWIVHEVVTGTPAHSARITLTYPLKLDSEVKEMGETTLQSFILHPDFKARLGQLDFSYQLPPTYKFAGITPQNELIFSPEGKTITLDAEEPYLTLSQMDFDLNSPDLDNDDFVNGLYQLFPAYYLPPVFNKPEISELKNKSLLISKGIISYPSLHFKMGLLFFNKKVYALKYFSQSAKQIDQFDIKKYLLTIKKL